MKKLMFILFGSFLSFSAVSAQSIELSPIRILGDQNFQQENTSFIGNPVSLADNVSGVDIQERSTFGFLQDVSIRGSLFEDTHVQLSGIPLDNPQTGHYNLSLPVVSTDIEGINADLNSQILNFNLRMPFREGSILRMAAGNAGFAESVVSMTRKVSGIFHRFSVEGMRTDGLLDETDGNRLAGSYMLSSRGIDQDFFIYAAVANKKFGASGAYAAPWYMKEQEEIKQELVMGEWISYGELDISIRPYIHRTQDTFLLNRDVPSFYRNDHTSLVTGNIIDVTDPDTGYYGTFEFQRDQIRSTNLGAHQRFSYSFDGGIKNHEKGRWKFDAGIKAKYFDQFPFELMPHAGVAYRLTNFWRLNADANRSFRQPSFTELYYNAPTDVGNAGLGLQRSDNVELGVEYQANKIHFKADVFYRRQENTIDWVRDSSAVQYQAINAGQVNVRGFDIDMGFPVDFVIADYFNFSYTRLDLNKDKRYDVSKYVFDYLRDRAILKLSSTKGKWRYALKAVYEHHISLGDRIIFSIEGDYRLNKDARIFALADNILDHDYEEFPHIEGSPLFVKAGLELRF